MPGTARIEHPVDALFHTRAVVVVILSSEAIALILSLMRPLDASWPIHFGLMSLALLWIAVVPLGGLFVARRWLRRLSPAAFPWLALCAVVVATCLVAHVGWILTGGAEAGLEGYGVYIARAATISVIAGMLALLIYQNYLQGRQLAIQHKEAELAVLRARVQPHFLFNTLNTGIALLHARPERAERLLLDLADLFRAAFGGPPDTPLREELALARQYLDIEALRFGERLELHWDVPSPESSLLDVHIPALSLQPLVENAIRHGIEPDLQGGRIEVRITGNGRQVRIEIHNTVPDASAVVHSGYGVGLAAVRARIASHGERGGHLEIDESRPGRFGAVIVLPRH